MQLDHNEFDLVLSVISFGRDVKIHNHRPSLQSQTEHYEIK